MKRALILLAAVVLTACSSIPTSGPIVRGDRVDVTNNDVSVRVIARPPTPGVSPEGLVRGFLAACASVADGDATARMYLTTRASAGWNPSRLITVYDLAALTVSADKGDTVRMSAPLIGTIDGQRRFTTSAPGSSVSESFALEQVDGQWRIASTPNALFLAEADVSRSFRPHEVFFSDPELRHLVPEYLMVPLSANSAARELMRALLRGPHDPLGMRSAIPSGTGLLNVSTSDAGLVTVQLTRAALTATGTARDAMLAQIVWTLWQLPDVLSVRVTVDGAALANRAGTTSLSSFDVSAFDPTTGDGEHRLVYVSGMDVMSLLGTNRLTLSTNVGVTEASSAPDRALLVGISGTRTLLYGLQGAGPWLVAAGGDLAAPTVLSTREIWYIDREATGGGLFRRPYGAEVVRVDTGLPSRVRVTDFAIAPDGVRIALIVNDGTTTTLRVGSIARTSTGVRLIGLARVEQRLSSVSAVAWASSSELAVLGTVGAVAVQPMSVSLPMGSVTMLGGPANPVSITAAPGEAIVVGDQSGQLWRFEDGKWTASELGSAPRYTL